MNALISTGYAVTNNEAIWGVGPTATEAWIDFEKGMEAAGTRILEEGEDCPDFNEGNYTRTEDYIIRPATKALLGMVNECGGDVAWYCVNGVACVYAEWDSQYCF